MNHAEQIQKKLERAGCARVDDATIESVELSNGEATILISSWKFQGTLGNNGLQDVDMRLKFTGVVYFKAFECGGDLSEIRLSEDSAAIREAIRTIEQDGGKSAGYPGLVEIAFMQDDKSVMTVVFQNLEIQS